ncbi:MAG: hypothetical protein JRJ59_00430, partial [Deltaproteobacteria bacterium]|nr:hypothetical protein [Deltaproteobacteria bacterium]
LMPLHHLPAQLVYSAHGGEVREAVVAGRPLMIDRELTTIDLTEVRARVCRMSRELC